MSYNEDVLLYDIQENETKITELFQRLGGSIRVGIIIDDPLQFLEKRYPVIDEKKKVIFAVTVYDNKNGKTVLAERKHKLGMQFKKWLRERGYSARFVSKQSQNETSVVLLSTNKVLEKGFELCSFVHPKTREQVWGITLSHHDYENFAKRDYSRPRVNKKKGMVPPKLARIMVNLAQQSKDAVIWDPFCGSGTILMEALLLGHTVVGSDIDPVSISESLENVKWTGEEYWITQSRYRILEHDILKGVPDGVEPDAIVTEPYLGPVLRKLISVAQVEKIIEEITPLYEALFSIAAKRKTDGKHGKLVVIVPGFKSHNDWVDMDVSSMYKDVIDITSDVSKHPLQWDRPHSIIRRNIKIFSY